MGYPEVARPEAGGGSEVARRSPCRLPDRSGVDLDDELLFARVHFPTIDS